MAAGNMMRDNICFNCERFSTKNPCEDCIQERSKSKATQQKQAFGITDNKEPTTLTATQQIRMAALNAATDWVVCVVKSNRDNRNFSNNTIIKVATVYEKYIATGETK